MPNYQPFSVTFVSTKVFLPYGQNITNDDRRGEKQVMREESGYCDNYWNRQNIIFMRKCFQ